MQAIFTELDFREVTGTLSKLASDLSPFRLLGGLAKPNGDRSNLKNESVPTLNIMQPYASRQVNAPIRTKGERLPVLDFCGDIRYNITAMRKRAKRPIRIRKRWALNPKTKVKESARAYSRPKEKKKVRDET